MNAQWTGFFAGALASLGTRMLFEDMLGLERYTEIVRVGWVHMSPWWSVIPIGVSLAMMAKAGS